MKRYLTAFLMFVLFLTAEAACAESTILVQQYEKYMCGDQFELEFPDVLSTSSMVSNASRVHAEAKTGERLLQVRIRIRNMTTEFFTGMSSESFKLTGYVRDRSLSYFPEIILNTDYFGSGNYYSYDKLPPLRMADVLLIYRVSSTLINWELSFTPLLSSGQTYVLDSVSYEPMEWTPCEGTFLFPAVRTLETGDLTRFIR
ncbi:MAG: hypothetical protein IJI14_13310 [Anaerolineaceae bacterium]|nr:hypothetical protein [Anaerolineaceae bacterium]